MLTQKMSKTFSIFLISVAFIGLSFAILATFPFGAGVSSDAARILSTAENLLNGRGFFDYSGLPLIWWPPLYPIILAFLAKIIGIDLFFVAWFLNIILHGLNIWIAGKWLFSVFQERVIWAYFGSIIVAISLSMFKTDISIGPDSFFITLSLIFFIVLGSWDGKTKKTLIFLGFLLAIATLHRLLAVVLVATGSIYILIKGKGSQRYIFSIATIFSVLSCLPLAIWLLFHNYMRYKTIFGPRSYEDMLPLRNSISFLEKILNWFIPYFTIQNNLPFARIGIFFIFLMMFILILKKNLWTSIIKQYSRPEVLPSILFSFLYFGVLIFTIDYFEHKYQNDDRFLVTLFVPVIGIILIAIDQIFSKIQFRKQISILITILFGIWFLYPIYNLYENISLSYHIGGVVENNIYNRSSYRNSVTLYAINRIIEKNNTPIILYSNNPAAVWFITRHDVKLLPIKSIKNNQVIKSELSSKPTSSSVYVVWLLPDEFEYSITPKRLAKIITLETIFSSTDGEIYYIDNK